MPPLRTLLLASTIALATCLGVGNAGTASQSNDGWIAFHADVGGPGDLYLVKPGGTDRRQLTHFFSQLPTAEWSPDGQRLAFLARQSGTVEVYVIDANGQHLRRLTRGEGDHWGQVSWAPDGKKLAFFCCGEQNESLYVIAPNGTGRRRLAVNSGQAAWSPNGKALAVLSLVDGDPELFAIAADGSGKSRLTNSAGEDVDPVWSRDGRRIAFTSARTGRPQIWIMNRDGSRQRRLVSDRWTDAEPVWSPDGKRLAFTSYRNRDPNTLGIGNAEIMVVNADGSGLRNLTASRYWEGQPNWSPDGGRIAFATRRDFSQRGGMRVGIITLDGTGARLLPALKDARNQTGFANSCCPVWQPTSH